MVKTKKNMKANRRAAGGHAAGSANSGAPSEASAWVEAIKNAKQLLQATGSVQNATALLKAIEG